MTQGSTGQVDNKAPAAFDALAYCERTLRAGDEDRWLSAQFASAAARPRLITLFALYHEIGRIPTLVREAPLGEIRLQWWREAVDAAAAGGLRRAHPAIEAGAACGLFEAAAMARLHQLIDAQARLLYDDPFSSVEDLAGWLARCEGALAAAAARAWEGLTPEAGLALEKAAVAYGLARRGRVLAPTLAGPLAERAAELAAEARKRLGELPEAAAAGTRYLCLARLYRGGRKPSGLSKRLRLFWATATGRIEA
ncbi:squalene/phytoene synthase family protein [Amphiplicatus metriothermophilus]|nr:squalene/phytoene synthase family protein [Amphiplicatus metriothermophilus]MBB5518346.1 phytoene synthase [Amphiplicatus metriothermophilus]